MILAPELQKLAEFEVLLCLCAGLFIYYAWRTKRELEKLEQPELKTHSDPGTLNDSNSQTSTSSEDLFQLAIEIWRIEQRLSKLGVISGESKNQGVINSLKKIKYYIEINNIMILDYTGQKYNPGLNVDVLSFEKDSKVSESSFKETVEPGVMYMGKIARRAKVIVSEKE